MPVWISVSDAGSRCSVDSTLATASAKRAPPPRRTGWDPASRALSASAGLAAGVAFPVGARRPGTRRLRSGLFYEGSCTVKRLVGANPILLSEPGPAALPMLVIRGCGDGPI